MKKLIGKNTYHLHLAIMSCCTVPQDIMRLVRLANQSLYHGPVYLDKDDNVMSCFDEGVTQFNDVKAWAEISKWCNDNIETLYWDDEAGCLMTEEPEGEEVDGVYYEPSPYFIVETSYQIKILLGKELASYI